MGQLSGNKIKPYFQRPSGTNVAPDVAAFYDWIQTSLNALIGQLVPSTGLQALNPNTLDPTNSQFISLGVRPSSLASALHYVATTTTITFYWDGTHSSKPLVIHRDDGTTTSPLVGKQLVSGLSANTLYYFYPFWQENVLPANNFGTQLPGVNWGIASGVGVGSPAFAFTSPNLAAAQIQISRDHIPLGSLLATSGIKTATSGTLSGTCGGGGGGAGAYLASTFT